MNKDKEIRVEPFDIIERLETLNLKKDDTLVVMVGGVLSNEAAIALRKAVEAKVPAGTKVMVLDSAAKLGVIRAEK